MEQTWGIAEGSLLEGSKKRVQAGFVLADELDLLQIIKQGLLNLNCRARRFSGRVQQVSNLRQPISGLTQELSMDLKVLERSEEPCATPVAIVLIEDAHDERAIVPESL